MTYRNALASKYGTECIGAFITPAESLTLAREEVLQLPIVTYKGGRARMEIADDRLMPESMKGTYFYDEDFKEIGRRLPSHSGINIRIEREGFALYFNGSRAHIGNFKSINKVREYWNSFRRQIVGSPKSLSTLIFGS